MVRVSLKYNQETKAHEWKVLDEKKPGLIIVETAHGTVTIPNYPLDGEAKTVICPVGTTAYIYNAYTHMVHRWRENGNWTIFSRMCQVRDSEAHKNLVKNEEHQQLHPLVPHLWLQHELWQLYNPVRQQWITSDHGLLSDNTTALMDVIEHDIIEHVSKTIPQVNAVVASVVAERATVEKEMSGIEKGVLDNVDKKE